MCQDPGFDTLSRTFNEVKRIAGLDEDLDFRSSRSQFTSAEYAAVAKELGVRLLVGRTDSCHDKAVAESWFSMLKYEIQYRRRFTTRAQARFHVMQYIEVFYNRRRRHSTLGYRTPASVHADYHHQTATAA